jgi:hypothetical protein
MFGEHPVDQLAAATVILRHLVSFRSFRQFNGEALSPHICR